MERSENLIELATALAKAQGELTSAPYDSINPHFKSRYSSLASFQNTYRPVLARHGLSFVQLVESDEQNHYVHSLLMHSSGQFLSARSKLILQKNDMQGLGSSITYLKRQQASAMLGISADEDDDGNHASKPSQRPGNHPRTTSLEEFERMSGLKPKSPAPGDYVMKGGKNVGKKVRDFSAKELNDLIDYANSLDPNEIPKELEEFASHAVDFLANKK